MGQQQLLLVLLVTILVGIATIIAFNILGSNFDNMNEDAVRQDMAEIASVSQAWIMRPRATGGGGYSFADITFKSIPFTAAAVSNDGKEAMNLNGRYVIDSADDSMFVIHAYPSSLGSNAESGPNNRNGLGPGNNPGLGPIENPGLGPGDNNPHFGNGEGSPRFIGTVTRNGLTIAYPESES